MVGRVDQNIFHDTDAINTFLQFRSKAESLPYVVDLERYDTIDSCVPKGVFEEPTILDEIVDIFPMTHRTLFYNSMLPMSKSQPPERIAALYAKLVTHRAAYPQDPHALEDSVAELKDMYDMTMSYVEQQALITQVRHFGYDDLKRYVLSFVGIGYS